MKGAVKVSKEDIIKKYCFWDIETEEQLIKAIANVSMMIASSYSYETYLKYSNKILLFDDFIDIILPTLKDDLGECFLGEIFRCAYEVYNINSPREVLKLSKERFNYILEEYNTVVIDNFAEAISYLEDIEDMLVLPEKWFSQGIYKALGEFLKTFNCERTKYKKRVAFKNNGEFTNEQIIELGKKLNGVSLSTKFDFFPTPDELVEKVQYYAEIKDTDVILEPSAGTGSLLKNLNNKDIDCVEMNDILSEILKSKGYNVYNMDFETFTTDKKYDKIIMNPPFGKRLDAKHIIKAFEFLKEGGILVAIHSSGICNATDKNSKAFQNLCDKHLFRQEHIDSGMFKNSGKGTMVSTTVSVLTK